MIGERASKLRYTYIASLVLNLRTYYMLRAMYIKLAQAVRKGVDQRLDG